MACIASKTIATPDGRAVTIRLYKKLGFLEEGLRPREIKIEPDTYVDVVARYRLVK